MTYKYLVYCLLIITVISVSAQDSINTELLEFYNPEINPEEFSPDITNKYFTLTPGVKFTYELVTEDETERTEFYVTNKTRVVMGIEAREIVERVWIDDELTEHVIEWYAQDKEGNVWDLGEKSKNIIDGEIFDSPDSWEAGVDGAVPGIIVKGNPKLDEIYMMEFYFGKADDKSRVISLDEAVTVPAGTYTNCLKSFDVASLKSHIKHTEDLAGRTVSAKSGTSETEARKYAGEVVTFEDSEAAKNALITEDIDAIIVDYVIGANLVRGDSEIMIVGAPFTREYYGIATNKENLDIIQKINNALRELKRDGTLKTITDTWI
jgi:hypothetical protein